MCAGAVTDVTGDSEDDPSHKAGSALEFYKPKKICFHPATGALLVCDKDVSRVRRIDFERMALPSFRLFAAARHMMTTMALSARRGFMSRTQSLRSNRALPFATDYCLFRAVSDCSVTMVRTLLGRPH
jgi:hypothetical protein